jgi:GntR family transcriptional regulator / MocR family aminotransferase
MDLVITLDNQSSLPLYRQLYEALRTAILRGQLPPKQRLPSTRLLAKSLGISRTTVTLCYEQLLNEGYLQTAIGSGTYVCAHLPDDLLNAAPVTVPEAIAHPAVSWSKYGHTLSQLIDKPLINEPDAAINFRYGRPAFDRFPIQLWRKLVARHCREPLDWLDYSPDPAGYQPLREAIARYLARSRAVQCTPEQVILTNGTQQAVHLITQLFIDPGDAIAMEDPGYLGARRTFLAQRATILPIAVDQSGLVIDQLKAAGDRIKLVYVTPSHQFPTGAVLPLPRRMELLAWAQQTGAMIIEDDYDSEYRYGVHGAAAKENRPIPALQGLDAHYLVLYAGTFSKVLFPALRIGYLVVPPHLIPVFRQAKWLADRQLPSLEQYALTDFINEGHLERHIRQMRTHYDQVRQVLVAAFDRYFGERATLLGENAGLHVMVRFHTSLSDAEICQRAAQVGVGLVSAQVHYLNPQRNGEFIFGYGEPSPSQLYEGIRRLAEIGL